MKAETTMLAAVELLQDLGATYEYPGYISIRTGPDRWLSCGTINGCFDCAIMTDAGDAFGFAEELPLTVDALELAAFIRKLLTQPTE